MNIKKTLITSNVIIRYNKDKQELIKELANELDLTIETMEENYVYISITIRFLTDEPINITNDLVSNNSITDFEYITLIPVIVRNYSTSMYNCFMNQLVNDVKTKFKEENPNIELESIMDIDLQIVSSWFNITNSSYSKVRVNYDYSNKVAALKHLHNTYMELYLK